MMSCAPGSWSMLDWGPLNSVMKSEPCAQGPSDAGHANILTKDILGYLYSFLSYVLFKGVMMAFSSSYKKVELVPACLYLV